MTTPLSTTCFLTTRGKLIGGFEISSKVREYESKLQTLQNQIISLNSELHRIKEELLQIQKELENSLKRKSESEFLQVHTKKKRRKSPFSL